VLRIRKNLQTAGRTNRKLTITRICLDLIDILKSRGGEAVPPFPCTGRPADERPRGDTFGSGVRRRDLPAMNETTRFIPEHRRQQHKGRNQFRGDELRRRREDQQVEIRKQKKAENLAKRRNLEGRFQEWNRDDDEGAGSSGSDDENEAFNSAVLCSSPPFYLLVGC